MTRPSAKYAEIARLNGPAVDLFIAETVASLAHARAVLEGAKAGGKPVWLSVTVDDEDGTKLRSGEPVAALGEDIAWQGNAGAILANCSAPEAMAAAMGIFKGFGLPFGAYANGFTAITKDFLKDSPTVAALSARPEMTPALYADVRDDLGRHGCHHRRRLLRDGARAYRGTGTAVKGGGV